METVWDICTHTIAGVLGMMLVVWTRGGVQGKKGLDGDVHGRGVLKGLEDNWGHLIMEGPWRG